MTMEVRYVYLPSAEWSTDTSETPIQEESQQQIQVSTESVEGNIVMALPTTTKRKSSPTKKSIEAKAKRRALIKEKRWTVKKFRSKWLEDERFQSWLKPLPDNELKCQCIACNVTLKAGLSELEKHAISKKHGRNIKMVNVNSLTNLIDIAIIETNSESLHKRKVSIAETKLAAFFAEHNVEIEMIEHLIPLLQETFNDSQIAKDLYVGHSKYISLIKDVIAKVESDETVKNLRQVPFSIIVDEITYDGLQKHLCVVVRYVLPNTGQLRTELLELINLDLRNDTPQKIFELFVASLASKEIPITNIVGMASDGDVKLVGEYNSFFSNLNTNTRGLILLQCICHTSAIVASKASDKLPRTPEELLHAIAFYVSASASRCAELCDIQKYFHSERKKLLKYSAVRWMALHPCIVRLLDKWAILELFFQQASSEDKLQSADFILAELNNNLTKTYIFFLKYSLTYVNSFNSLFQSHKILIHNLPQNSVKIFRQVCQNFLEPCSLEANVDLTLTSNFLSLDKVYLGPECEQLLKEMPQETVIQVRQNCLDFYVVAATEMQTRLPLKTELFLEMSFLQPDVALHSDGRGHIPELTSLGKHFEDRLDVNALSVEWRSLPYNFSSEEKSKLSKLELDVMWNEISQMKDFADNPQFPNLGILSKLVLTLPHSNAEVERIFCTIADVANKRGSTITEALLDAMTVIRTKFEAKSLSCTSFQIGSSHLDICEH